RGCLAGRYGEAKTGFTTVDRSGVSLSSEQQLLLDKYQLKLVGLAGDHPELFGFPSETEQPGTVKRREEPAAQPPTTPAAQPPAPPPSPPPPAAPPRTPPPPPPPGDNLLPHSLPTHEPNR